MSRGAARRRVGLVGAGRWGRHILRDLIQLGCDVAVVDPSAEARERALEGGASSAAAALPALPDCAGVIVATPTTTHAAVAEQLLSRNVPIFVEKPLTADPDSAMWLARRAPAQLFVMHKWQYHPGIEMLRDIAWSGELGPVLGLRTMRLGWDGPHPDTDAIWILAPHDLSIGIAVLGAIPEPRSAVGHQIGDTPTGLIAVLGAHPWMVFEVGIASAERCREVVLYCRDGAAVLRDGYSAHLEVFRHPSVTEPECRSISTELPLLRELRAFVAHLSGGPPPRASVAEGAAVVAAIARLRELAGFDSSRRGSPAPGRTCS